MDKKKLYKITKRYINNANVKIAILFIPLTLITLKEIRTGTFSVDDFYDTSILISFLIVFLCEGIATGIIRFVERKTEDDVKLNRNYESLVEKYIADKDKMVCWINEDKTIYIPAICLYEKRIRDAKGICLEIEKDSEHCNYILPKQVVDNSNELFNAHSHSIIYNNINIRLNDLIVEENLVRMVYGFTTYFDSLLTNRAMDYTFIGNRTVREIYEPGPFVHELSKSKLSNHLGFNGFVELSDGYIVFLRRGKNLSIAKGMWQQSIGASLKTKYCINNNHELDVAGISNAIRLEIEDELKIEVKSDQRLDQTIFAFYRDLVEGGKPQFLFYYKTTLYDKKSFLDNFKDKMSVPNAKKENKKKQLIDGDKFAFYKIEELRKCSFKVDLMIDSDNKKYEMMPSTIASILLLLKNC